MTCTRPKIHDSGSALTEKALAFVRLLLDSPVPRIALENPVGCISTRIRKPDQTVQPWMFGHGETKATCLWLKNLPPLVPTASDQAHLFVPTAPAERGRRPRILMMAPAPNRQKERSRTYPGLAAAMAMQWG